MRKRFVRKYIASAKRWVRPYVERRHCLTRKVASKDLKAGDVVMVDGRAILIRSAPRVDLDSGIFYWTEYEIWNGETITLDGRFHQDVLVFDEDGKSYKGWKVRGERGEHLRYICDDMGKEKLL